MTNTQGMTKEQMIARIQELEAAANRPKPIWYKVSEKGALSCYGLNAKFPVTLYIEQLERFEADKPNRDAFIAAHKTQFTHKADKQAN